jgi:hypothetical protein
MFTTLRFLHGSNDRPGLRDLAHDFVVKSLPRPHFMAPRPYEYYCLRCGWSFLFNSPKGLVTALDPNGRPLDDPGNTARSRTFASGPCPALAKVGRLSAVPKSEGRSTPPQDGLRPGFPLVLRPPVAPVAGNDDAALEELAEVRGQLLPPFSRIETSSQSKTR